MQAWWIHWWYRRWSLIDSQHMCMYMCVCMYVYTRECRDHGYTSDVEGALSQTAHVCVCICVYVCMHIHVNAGMMDTLVMSPVPEGLAGYWPFDDPISQVCLYVCVSVVICVSACVCVCLRPSTSSSKERKREKYASFLRCVFVYLCLSVSMSLCLRVPVSLCLCICASMRLCAWVSGHQCVSACVYVYARRRVLMRESLYCCVWWERVSIAMSVW